MSTAEPLSGPWEAIGNLVRTPFGQGNPDMRGLLVAEVPGQTPESHATARLIASAHELLAVAEKVLEQADMYTDPQLLAAAAAAVSKANGDPA